MVSNMLSANEFYRWHPEVVKAVALNSWYENEGKVGYRDLVFNQGDVDNMHISYYFIGDVNTLMKEYDDSPAGSDLSGWRVHTKEIRFNFNRKQLLAGGDASLFEGFNISIAWLNSGNDIYNLGGLPQEFDIEVYSKRNASNLENGDRAWLRASTYGGHVTTPNYPNINQHGNPYKTCRVAGYRDEDLEEDFTVRIVLTDEDSRAENYGQMVLGLDIKPIFKYGK